MFRYRVGDIYSLLWAAYSEVRQDPKAPSVVVGSGSAKPSARLDRQLQQAAACKVVSLIDREFPEYAACFFRFVFGDSTWEDYCCLSKWLVAEVDLRLQSPRMGSNEIKFLCNVGRLCTLAPYQYRYRLEQNSEMYLSERKLAELVGVPKTSYRNNYKPQWEFLLSSLSGICEDHAVWILDFAECDPNDFEKSA